MDNLERPVVLWLDSEDREGFIPNEQIEKHFKLAAPLPTTTLLSNPENWPPDLPSDFGRQILTLMGLGKEYCLLPGRSRRGDRRGWYVVHTRDLVDLLEGWGWVRRSDQ